MLIGYARVSTHEQNLDHQEDVLNAAGCQKVYTNKTSGIKDDRPGLETALADVRPGDSLVVWKLDRFGGQPQASHRDGHRPELLQGERQEPTVCRGG